MIPVIEALEDKSPEVRKEAVRTAGLLRDRRALDALLSILKNQEEDGMVRVQAVFALKRLDSDIILEPLLNDAANGERKERLNGYQVILALSKDEESVLVKKENILSLLQKGINDDDNDIRRIVLEIAGQLKRDEVVKVVIQGMSDPDIAVRREAVRVRKALNRSELFREIKKLVRDRDKGIRREAILALSEVSPEAKDIALLKEVVKSEKDQEIRVAAFSSLAKVESGTAIRLITDELKIGTSTLRSELLVILGTMSNTEAMQLLITYLEKDKNVEVQRSAVQSLRRFLKKKEAFSVLQGIIKDTEKALEVRKDALTLLVDWGKKNNGAGMAFPYLSRILKDKKDPLRAGVISAVAAMGEKRGVPSLLEILKDRTEQIDTRKSALSALVDLAPDKTLKQIEEYLILKT